jgi:spore photoproduct lyase
MEDLWRELDGFIRRRKGRFVRLGTGELADSLALDHLTLAGREFVSYFRGKPNAFFELKTKTANIDRILDCAPADNVVISWSLNSEKIGRQEEKGAPSVHERIEAARLISRRGFPVGFHFDPLILYPGWEEDYGQVIDELRAAVPISRIRWISLGSLRFPPALKPVIEKRFPRSKIIYGEMVPGRDGKLRYFKPLRLELYRKIVGFLTCSGGPQVPLYFCMEDAEVWGKVLNRSPRRKDEF